MATTKRIVFLAFGQGSGHAIWGAALYNALQRAQIDVEFIMLTDSPYAEKVASWFPVYTISLQPSLHFSSPRTTDLYLYLRELDPDLLIVDSIWVPLEPIINDFTCKKVILFRMFPEKWFTLTMGDRPPVPFNINDYDLALNCEPNFKRDDLVSIEPLVIRNHDEILSREDARKKLGIAPHEKLIVIGHNGFAGEIEKLARDYGIAEKNTKVLITTNLKGEGLFPLADYARGIDLLISGAGYNTFYETKYFDIPSKFIPQARKGDEQHWRISQNSHYQFTENGADQSVTMIRAIM